MQLFILTTSELDIPSLLIYQKVAEIINAGKAAKQLQFYIIGDHIPQHFQEVYAANENKVTLLTTRAAQNRITQVTNAMVLHFGAHLKGSNSFKHYFIPLTLPNIDNTNSFISNVIQQHKFKKWIKTAAGVFYLNEWAEFALSKKVEKLGCHFKNAILPMLAPPSYDWLVLSETKSALTDGSNYFLFFTQPANFIAALKEFSHFKKWQQTTMAMVFVFDSYKQCAIADNLLKGYKYKASIYIKCIHELKMEWIAAAYAIFWGHINFNKIDCLQWAIHYDIPNLLNQNNFISETWLSAGEVFSFVTPHALSDHFKLYYRDEVYRQARANMGAEWLTNLALIAPPLNCIQIPTDLKP